MSDGWMYQGRQSHGWFGHGTGPGKAQAGSATAQPAAGLAQRIHAIGHTLIAGLPASKRYHDAARLSGEDHGRLDRLLTAVVQALPLGRPAIAGRVFGMHSGTPGIDGFVQAARLLRGAQDNADLRAATDAVGQAAQDVGLDHFKRFLRRADDHLTETGGMAALLQDVSKPATTVILANWQRLAGNDQGEINPIVPTGGTGPTVPPPDGVPGGPWKWLTDPNNSRGGKFVGSHGAIASWDDVDGHWDIDNGQGQRTRYNRFGSPLTPEEAHGPYKGPPRLPLPFRLFKMLPPLFILPEQTKEALSRPNSA